MEDSIYGKKEKEMTEKEQRFLANVAEDLQSDDSFVKEMLLKKNLVGYAVEDDDYFMRVYSRVLSKRVYK